MRHWRSLVRIMTMVFLVLALALPSAIAEEGTGDGGGTKVPTLTGITVSSVKDAGAVVVFAYTNNVGAKGSTNIQYLWAQDSTGKAVPFTVKYWPDPSDARKRELEMHLSGLSPSTAYTVGIRAGVVANNGQVSPSSGSRTFTTSATVAPPPVDNPVTPPPSGNAGPGGAGGTGNVTVPGAATGSVPAPSGTDIPAWTGDGAADSRSTEDTTSAPGSGGGTGGGKDQPLSLEQSDPADGEKGVPTDAQIVMKFSKNVVYLAVRDDNKDAFSLWNGDRKVPVEVLMVDDQLDFEQRNFVTLKPLAELEEATEYTVRVEESLTSKSGASLLEPVEFTFYTVGYRAFDPILIAIGGTVLLAAVLVVVRTRRRAAGADGAETVSDGVAHDAEK